MSGTGPGRIVLVERTGETFETRTDSNSEFTFLDLPQGSWNVRIASPGWVPENGPEARIEVPSRGCAFVVPRATLDGKIEGTIRGPDGQTMAGVMVQVFGRGPDGKDFDSSPMKTVVSGADGSYSFYGLPAARYLVAVNGNKYRDESPYEPVFYPVAADRRGASPIALGELEIRRGIDFSVGSPRLASILTIIAAFADGTAVERLSASAENQSGVQRAHSTNILGNTLGTSLELPLWVGETYRIEVRDYGRNLQEFRAVVSGFKPLGSQETLRVTLRPVPRPVR